MVMLDLQEGSPIYLQDPGRQRVYLNFVDKRGVLVGGAIILKFVSICLYGSFGIAASGLFLSLFLSRH